MGPATAEKNPVGVAEAVVRNSADDACRWPRPDLVEENSEGVVAEIRAFLDAIEGQIAKGEPLSPRGARRATGGNERVHRASRGPWSPRSAVKDLRLVDADWKSVNAALCCATMRTGGLIGVSAQRNRSDPAGFPGEPSPDPQGQRASGLITERWGAYGAGAGDR
jgi:hypothetical protein